jgi:hypothetical protein
MEKLMAGVESDLGELEAELRASLAECRRRGRADRDMNDPPTRRRYGPSRQIVPPWALNFGVSQLNPNSRNPSTPVTVRKP